MLSRGSKCSHCGVVPPLSGPPSLPVGCTRPDCRARAPGRLMNSPKPVLESSGGLGVLKSGLTKEASCAPQRRRAPPQRLVRWSEAHRERGQASHRRRRHRAVQFPRRRKLLPPQCRRRSAEQVRERFVERGAWRVALLEACPRVHREHLRNSSDFVLSQSSLARDPRAVWNPVDSPVI